MGGTDWVGHLLVMFIVAVLRVIYPDSVHKKSRPVHTSCKSCTRMRRANHRDGGGSQTCWCGVGCAAFGDRRVWGHVITEILVRMMSTRTCWSVCKLRHEMTKMSSRYRRDDGEGSKTGATMTSQNRRIGKDGVEGWREGRDHDNRDGANKLQADGRR